MSVRHSHQDAVDERTFEELLEATHHLTEPFDIQCRFVLVAAGRLGMRAGEIAHVREDWVDWERGRIKIPAFDPCDKGKHGGLCGYCKKRAQERAEHADDLTLREARAERWEPKTNNSARSIPFDFDADVEDAVEEFFWYYDQYPASRVSINRRVDRVAEEMGYPTERVYPHSLRATAATWHAYSSLPPTALQALMGWSKLSVAQKYIRLSGEQTAQSLREAHQG